MKMFKNFPIIYKTARPAGRTEMRPYKQHIINKLTAPQTPNNHISSPLTSYLLLLTSYLLPLPLSATIMSICLENRFFSYTFASNCYII